MNPKILEYQSNELQITPTYISYGIRLESCTRFKSLHYYGVPRQTVALFESFSVQSPNTAQLCVHYGHSYVHITDTAMCTLRTQLCAHYGHSCVHYGHSDVYITDTAIVFCRSRYSADVSTAVPRSSGLYRGTGGPDYQWSILSVVLITGGPDYPRFRTTERKQNKIITQC
jgi:hypothetical protein